MSFIRPTNGYARMSDAKLSETAFFVHEQISNNTAIFPPFRPTMAEFYTACNEFYAAAQAAIPGGRLVVAQRDNKKDILVNLFHQVNYYVFCVANGDRAIVELAGIPIAKEPAPKPGIVAPTDVKIVVGIQTGIMDISVKRVPGAVAYMHEYTTDPNLKEENWITHTCSKAKCRLTGLTPGVMYYIRVAAIGPKDQIMYSDVVSKIAA